MNDFEVFFTETQLTDGTAVDLRPQFNTDGLSIVFERRTPVGSELWLLDRRSATHACAPIECCNFGAQRTMGRAAFFRLDDFAYVSDRGGRPAIWHANLVTGRTMPMTQPVSDEADFGPTTMLSAQGRYLFFRTIGEGAPHLYEGMLGGDVMPLTKGAEEADQAWFLPGAAEIVFHSCRDRVSAVYKQAARHGAPAKRLSTADEGTRFVTPFPSPDGRHVVFASAVGGTSQIWVMRIDGSNRQRLTSGPVPCYFPAWSPRGDEIVFVRGSPFAPKPMGALVSMKLKMA